MRRKAAIAIANWARQSVPLYQELYRDVPAIETWRDFRRLPVLTAARLGGTPLAEQVDSLDDVLRTFTSYRLQSAVTPAAVVADRDDTDAAYEEWRDAFAAAGVRAGTRLVMLTPPHQRYFAAELGDMLGYWGVQAHLVVSGDRAGLARSTAALAPDAILGLDGEGADTMRPSITVRRPAGQGADLYVTPVAGAVAVRPSAGAAYRPLTRFYLLEARRDGRLLITALRRFHQPLIRYELPDRGRIVRGMLWLDEVAP